MLLSTLLIQIKLVYGPFGQSIMHSTFDFCHTPTSQERNECTTTQMRKVKSLLSYYIYTVSKYYISTYNELACTAVGNISTNSGFFLLPTSLTRTDFLKSVSFVIFSGNFFFNTRFMYFNKIFVWNYHLFHLLIFRSLDVIPVNFNFHSYMLQLRPFKWLHTRQALKNAKYVLSFKELFLDWNHKTSENNNSKLSFSVSVSFFVFPCSK